MSDFPDLRLRLRIWPATPVPATRYADAIQERLRVALYRSQTIPGSLGLGDLAILIRQVLRWEAAKHSGYPKLLVPTGRPWPTKTEWRKFGCRASENGSLFEVEALSWEPDWISAPPFAAAERRENRRTSNPVRADPVLRDRFRRDQYLSGNQAEAVRAVLLSPPGAIRLIVLPTGAGKSLVGLSAALLGTAELGGVSIFVVPTVALALDQVRQAKLLSTSAEVDAWHSGLGPIERQAIRDRMRDGLQRVLFCAPESIVGGLATTLMEVAGLGQLQAFVVDEAHLVGQWGTSFRPEFQSMSAVWRKLRERCPTGRTFRTILMTATLTRDTFSDLRRFFGDPEQFESLSAVYLRQEPDYHKVRCDSAAMQVDRVLEVLRYAPRPAILYVTKVADAKRWHRRCIDEGWLRTGLIHGECGRREREQVLDAWNSNELDLVIGTSAFGLGMDKSDVRLVMHVCVPETVDRFYQEVGRGGRDGCATVSLMLWTERDIHRARKLSSPQIVSAEIGFQRWRSMWTTRREVDDVPFINLNAKRPDVRWDGERNKEWNLKTLLLLARAGVLEIENANPPDPARKSDESSETYFARCAEVRQEFEGYVPVKLVLPNPATARAWDLEVGEHRNETRAAAAANWQRMEDMLRDKRDRQEILREVYCVPDAGVYSVGEGPDDVFLTVPKSVCAQVGDALRRVMPASGSGLLLVTYGTAGIQQREVSLRIIELLKRCAKNGVREIALPDSWQIGSIWPGSLPNPLKVMTTQTPENFLLARDINDRDPEFEGFMAVPRVSFLPPTHVPNPIPAHLFLLRRPLHLILVPAECRDHQHPNRRVGDAGPESIHLDDLLRLLKQ